MQERPQILLTNDDGILSPGLWAAAAALEKLGYVHVVAPREQSTSMGRSMPMSSDGIIETRDVVVNGRSWRVHAVGGTPAQAVLHAVLEVMPARPNLLVSGINYGENFGTGVTISGTVGAAMEGAAFGIPSLAVSLEVDKAHHFSYSEEVDFGAAAYFTGIFAEVLLTRKMPEDVDLLKVEIPQEATPTTKWRISRLATLTYYESVAPKRTSWLEPGKLDYREAFTPEDFPHDTDVFITKAARKVAVTPLSLDMTSRTDLSELEALLRGMEQGK